MRLFSLGNAAKGRKKTGAEEAGLSEADQVEHKIEVHANVKFVCQCTRSLCAMLSSMNRLFLLQIAMQQKMFAEARAHAAGLQ